ncbi:hypothetical protein AcW2_005888 [Taiwanofungus camphoratus]|nr:hypothetical protein AcW2_005888 [Antrodia cinnamomea]
MTDTSYTSETDDTVPELQKRPWSVPTYMSEEDGLKTPPPRNWSVAAASQATPLKLKGIYDAAGEDGTIVDEGAKRYVRTHFRDKVHRGLSIHEFVRAVWNFTSAVMPNVAFYTLPIDSVNKYLQCRWEKNSYKPLVEILQHVLSQASSSNRPNLNRKRLGKLSFFRLRERTVKGHYAEALKPDLAWGTAKCSQRRHWEWYLGFIEVKKGSRKPLKRKVDMRILPRSLKMPTSPVCKPRVATSNKTVACASIRMPSGVKRKGTATVSEDIEPPPPKRSRSNANDDMDTNMASVEHINVELNPDDQPVLTDDEVQAGKYMNELLSHGIRSYATGCMIRDTTVTLWYGDRMGIVQSESFNFLQQPHLLVLILAAMDSADHEHMGICPFITFPRTSYHEYSGAKLELDDQLAIDVNENPLEKLVFDIDTARRVITEFGAVGRGTTVVPIKATGTAKIMFGKDDLVAKMAWPSKDRDAEDNFIRVIRTGLKEHAPRWVDHVVDLKCSVTRHMEEMDFPRIHMTGLLNYEERLFRIMIMKKY